jgi:uncharacterized protein DUF4279
MTDQSESTVTLRIFGESLVPSEISALLGSAATDFYRKGDALPGRSKDGGPRIAARGMWRTEVDRCTPADLNIQISQILSQLTQDIAVWTNLDPTFELDLFCGFFMSDGNEVVSLPPAILGALAERRIELILGIYRPCSD